MWSKLTPQTDSILYSIYLLANLVRFLHVGFSLKLNKKLIY